MDQSCESELDIKSAPSQRFTEMDQITSLNMIYNVHLVKASGNFDHSTCDIQDIYN